MTPEVPTSRRAFAALLSLPDDAIDLGQAALLIARDEYPHLDVGAYLVRLDQMADTIRGRLRGGEGFTSQIAHLNRLLFEDLGFRGNVSDYYDPRNSFLNDVLDRRVGIPISLSTIYLEVARRIGCPLAGVAFTGHFLVRYTGHDAATDIFIDPFNRGAILTEAECRRLLASMYHGRIEFTPDLLKRARNRQILERMLYNLRSIYAGEKDFHRTLRIQQLLLCIHPEGPREIRDRGLIQDRLALLSQAAADLETYVTLAPGAPDIPRIRIRLQEIQRLAPRMN